ncbi:MAG: ankyrin repeat domain-containing protein [Comamonas sp.]
MPIAQPPVHSITIRRNFFQAPPAEARVTEPPDDGARSWPPSRQDAIDTYHQGIDTLNQVLDMDDQAHAAVRWKLRQFLNFVTDGIRDGFMADVRDHFMTQTQLDFGRFCGLAQQPDIPLDARRQAILNLAEGMAVCAPGVAQHIETAARELQALTSVAQNFGHRLTSAIEHHIQDFMRQQGVCKHAGNEIHYVAAFFNRVAHQFGLPKRTDALMPKDLAQALLDAGAGHVLDANPVERVITQMADDYLARIAAFHASHQQNARADSIDLQILGTLHQKFQADLKPQLDSLFGPVDDGLIFHTSAHSEDERYWLTSDTTLIARAIARNLRAADVVAFKSSYVIGVPGEGIKLKQLGEGLFYVSETHKSAGDDPKEANVHQHQALDRFVLEDLHRGRKLLDQLDQMALAAPSMSTAKAAQEDFWKKMPLALYREMKDAPGAPESVWIFRQTMALLDSDGARNRFALALLEQAALGNQPQIGKLIFDQLNPKQFVADDKQCCAAMIVALQHGNERFAVALANEMDSALYSVQDKEGYTLLMYALECDQPEAASLFVQRMSPQQLSLQEIDGHTALMGALIKAQTGLAAKIIDQLDARQLHLQNADGHNALMLALMSGQTEGAKDIIDKSQRKQLLLRNQDGQTARDIALRCGEKEIAQFLKEKSSRWLSWLYRS